MNALAASLLLTGGAAGAWLLRRAWSLKTGAAPYRWSGWATLAATLVAASSTVGTMRGAFVALTLAPVAALAVVAVGLQIRAVRANRNGRDSLAPEPLERPSTTWRGVLRWLLAGPIGMIAAMAVGICYAVWMPGEAQTRLVTGGLIVPVAWGGAMTWTLADNRILRATAVLVGTAVVGFAAAALKGFA